MGEHLASMWESLSLNPVLGAEARGSNNFNFGMNQTNILFIPEFIFRNDFGQIYTSSFYYLFEINQPDRVFVTT